MENKIKTKKAMLEVIELLAGALESNTEDKVYEDGKIDWDYSTDGTF